MALDPNAAEVVRAYRLVFGSPDGQIVLRDMMKFCRFRADIEDQIGEGKRRAFLHILEHSQLADEQIFALYAGRGMIQQEEKDTDG